MEKLGINIKLLIAQLINFGLFFFIFKKYLAKPFANFMSDEAKKEKEKEKILTEIKNKEEEMLASQAKSKASLKKEYDLALKNAKEEALELKKKHLVEAKKDAEQIIVRARKQIETERGQMEKEMKKKIFELSTTIVDKGFSNFLTSEMQKEINRNILKNLPKNLN